MHIWVLAPKPPTVVLGSLCLALLLRQSRLAARSSSVLRQHAWIRSRMCQTQSSTAPSRAVNLPFCPSASVHERAGTETA